MNQSEEQLKRLLRAAGAARSNASDPLPFGAETRILARWRGIRFEEEAIPVQRLLRVGLVFACATVILTAAVSWQGLKAIDTEEVFVTSPAVNWVWVR
ncbi:MAG TPA: hypothetical protein VHH73_15505 [Verrucomicrobiae bacterium]|nr:hypothetical protein [Verrucomicrobiae bacterium]